MNLRLERNLITSLKNDFIVLLSCNASAAAGGKGSARLPSFPFSVPFSYFPVLSCPSLSHSPYACLHTVFLLPFLSLPCFISLKTEDIPPQSNGCSLPPRIFCPNLKMCPASPCNGYTFSNPTLTPSPVDIITSPASLSSGDLIRKAKPQNHLGSVDSAAGTLLKCSVCHSCIRSN